MSWWTGAALGFDIESDDKVPTEARIITAATVLVTPGNAPQDIETMVQPERDIPAEATKIHGITTERAREEGLPREQGIAATALTIAELAGPNVPLVGHNVSYDLTLLDREMRRLDIGRIVTQRGSGLAEIYFAAGYGNEGVDIGGAPEPAAVFPVIDTYVLDKAVDRYRKGKRQLSFVAAHYGVPMAEGTAHGATADVYASLRIAYKIFQRTQMAADYIATFGGGSGPMSFQFHPFMRFYGGRRDPLDIVRAFAAAGSFSTVELHQQERFWALEQAESLREHFVTSGTGDPAGVDGRWPIRPMDENEAVETVETTLI